MDTMTELKIVVRCAVERFIVVREPGESRKSVFERDAAYREMMEKIKVLREEVNVTLEDADIMFINAGEQLVNNINF